ncbi:MAG: 50S ribosomal protein L29 [Candidatus Yanofskybacteria bacterium]|nr:50S ribosomal protein L29 [Candidatus Yanofskybacteria bacterium]
MKFSELQLKSKTELNEMLKELQIKLGKSRFELANKSLKDTSQIGKTRRDIARIITAINNVKDSAAI